MTYDFIINTENVNEYYYRVLTDGIDYKQYMRNPVVLFMHEREFDKKDDKKGTAVIGKCVKLWKKGTDLVATIEFDMGDEFAAAIAGKVERGYIRMASMYADVKSTSSEPDLMMPGQVYETVTACKLVEISIVDIGGNDGAIRLSRGGAPIKLKEVNSNNLNMSQLKTIALALSLPADSHEDKVLGEVQQLRLSKQESDRKVSELETQLNGIKTAEATELVGKAAKLGLIPDSLVDSQIKAFEGNHEGQKAILTKLIEDKEATGTQSAASQVIKEVVLGKKGNSSVTTIEENFDYLQKHDHAKLGKIREENPTLYAQLAKDYAKGVRHTVKQ